MRPDKRRAKRERKAAIRRDHVEREGQRQASREADLRRAQERARELARWDADRAREKAEERRLVERRLHKERLATLDRLRRERAALERERERLDLGLTEEQYAELQEARAQLVGWLSRAARRMEARRPRFGGFPRGALGLLLALAGSFTHPDPWER